MPDIIYKANGEVIETSPKNGTNYSLEELKEIVGGYIEIIHLPIIKSIVSRHIL